MLVNGQGRNYTVQTGANNNEGRGRLAAPFITPVEPSILRKTTELATADFDLEPVTGISNLLW